MAILKERQEWRKPRSPKRRRRALDLEPDEQQHVRAALRFLIRRYGSHAATREALDITPTQLKFALSKRGRPSAGIALRAARAAGVPLEDILTGAWPKPGACPMCGRCD